MDIHIFKKLIEQFDDLPPPTIIGSYSILIAESVFMSYDETRVLQ